MDPLLLVDFMAIIGIVLSIILAFWPVRRKRNNVIPFRRK